MNESGPTMKQSLTCVLAAAALIACGRSEPAPDTGAPAPGESPAAEMPGDTLLHTDGLVPDPAPGTDAGTPAVPGGTPGGQGAPQGGGTQPSPGTGGATPAGPTAGAQQPAGSTQQAADEGATLLRRASAAYESVRSLQADFVMNFENPLLRQRLVSRGTLYQRQPDRIALRFTEPAGDLILGDGQYFYMYQPSNNPDQYFRQPAAAAGETGVNLHAQFVGNPVERFNYTVEGAESVGGRPARILNLVPRQRADYRSLKVWIDERDALVRRFELVEHNGNVRRFDLQNMRVNAAIADAIFRFTPPPNARAISPG
jgi:outer membrane lipoprotein carrier protein